MGGSWDLFGASRSTKEGLQIRLGTLLGLVCLLLAAEGGLGKVLGSSLARFIPSQRPLATEPPSHPRASDSHQSRHIERPTATGTPPYVDQIQLNSMRFPHVPQTSLKSTHAHLMPSPAASNCCATADAVEHGHDANTCVTQRDDKPVHRHQCLRCSLLTVVECVSSVVIRPRAAGRRSP